MTIESEEFYHLLELFEESAYRAGQIGVNASEDDWEAVIKARRKLIAYIANKIKEARKEERTRIINMLNGYARQYLAERYTTAGAALNDAVSDILSLL